MILSTTVSLLPTWVPVTLLLASRAAAHGFISHLVADSKLYWGWNPWHYYEWSDPPPPYRPENAVGWPNGAFDAGYVWPDEYALPNIICNRGATPAQGHVPVKAGTTLHVQWRTWPQSHSGPILTYLAPCVGTATGCGDVNPSALKFTKIDDSAPGLHGYDIEPPGYFQFSDGAPSGTWSTHVLIARNLSWQVALPEGLPPGPYVMRQEAFNLEYAMRENSAQTFVWCVNLWVTEGSTGFTTAFDLGSGVPATSLYHYDDPGMNLNIYQPQERYDTPGPPLAAGARPIPISEQWPQPVTELGTPVKVSGQTAEEWPNDEEAADRMALFLSGATTY